MGLLDSRLDTVSMWDEQSAGHGDNGYGRGIVYYLDDDKSVVGVLTLNCPDKMDTAKRLVQFGVPVDDPKEAMDLIYLGK